MKRFFGTVTFAAIIVGFLWVVADGAAAKNPSRPFKGESQEMVVGSCELGGIAGSFWSGAGNATHMGLFTHTGCVVVTGGAFPVFKFASRGVATAANGDQTYYAITGTTIVLSDPCVADGTLTVVGGTGRFAAASGEIHTTSITPWSAPYTCGLEQMTTLLGTIVY